MTNKMKGFPGPVQLRDLGKYMVATRCPLHSNCLGTEHLRAPLHKWKSGNLDQPTFGIQSEPQKPQVFTREEVFQHVLNARLEKQIYRERSVLFT